MEQEQTNNSNPPKLKTKKKRAPRKQKAATANSNGHSKKATTMHIDVGADLKAILVPFAEKRGKSESAIIRYALEKLFEEEAIDPKKEIIMRESVVRRFSIPKGYKLRSFWMTLYMLSEEYPNASSKDFWGEMVYLSGIKKSHKTIWQEILEELERGQNQ